MRWYTILFALATSAAVGFAAGCSDDSDSGNSLDKNKKVSDLTDEEAQQLCEDYAGDFNQAITMDDICMYSGVVAGTEALTDKEAACDAAYQACKQQSVDFDFGELACSSAEGSTESEADSGIECDLTVGEWEKCATDMLNVFKSAMLNLSCTSPEAKEIIPPSSCQNMNEACPGAIEDVDAGVFASEIPNLRGF